MLSVSRSLSRSSSAWTGALGMSSSGAALLDDRPEEGIELGRGDLCRRPLARADGGLRRARRADRTANRARSSRGTPSIPASAIAGRGGPPPACDRSFRDRRCRREGSSDRLGLRAQSLHRPPREPGG